MYKYSLVFLGCFNFLLLASDENHIDKEELPAVHFSQQQFDSSEKITRHNRLLTTYHKFNVIVPSLTFL